MRCNLPGARRSNSCRCKFLQLNPGNADQTGERDLRAIGVARWRRVDCFDLIRGDLDIVDARHNRKLV